MPQSPFAATTTRGPANTQTQGTTDAQGNTGIVQGHGSKYSAAYGKRLFVGANPSGVMTSVGLATTYVGLCLSNPAGSGKNLAVMTVTGQFIVAPSTVTALGLIGGYSAAGIVTHTTPLTPASQFIGSNATPVGLVDSACTLVGTPTWIRYLAETLVATDLPNFVAEIKGGIIVPPGGYIAIGTTIAGPASGFVGSFEWEEIAP